jgi:hypothetical protein
VVKRAGVVDQRVVTATLFWHTLAGACRHHGRPVNAELGSELAVAWVLVLGAFTVRAAAVPDRAALHRASWRHARPRSHACLAARTGLTTYWRQKSIFLPA